MYVVVRLVGRVCMCMQWYRGGGCACELKCPMSARAVKHWGGGKGR